MSRQWKLVCGAGICALLAAFAIGGRFGIPFWNGSQDGDGGDSGLSAKSGVHYLFHYDLSQSELSDLPADIALLVGAIKDRRIESLPVSERMKIFSRCPSRHRGQKRDRLLWGLDGSKPDEGDRCVWIDLDMDGNIVGCGLVRMG